MNLSGEYVTGDKSMNAANGFSLVHIISNPNIGSAKFNWGK